MQKDLTLQEKYDELLRRLRTLTPTVLSEVEEILAREDVRTLIEEIAQIWPRTAERIRAGHADHGVVEFNTLLSRLHGFIQLHSPDSRRYDFCDQGDRPMDSHYVADALWMSRLDIAYDEACKQLVEELRESGVIDTHARSIATAKAAAEAAHREGEFELDYQMTKRAFVMAIRAAAIERFQTPSILAFDKAKTVLRSGIDAFERSIEEPSGHETFSH